MPIARYAVIGNPVAHSLSPLIHAAFARQTGEAIEYTRLLAPIDAFALTARRFFESGGRGLNVTVPFKRAALDLAVTLTERAKRAGAINTLTSEHGALRGDNTDGVGLVADLERLGAAHGFSVRGARVLLLGAGGAARGAIGPLLAERPRALVVANRSVEKAEALVRDARRDIDDETVVEAIALAAFDTAPGSAGSKFDLVINATSASLSGATLALPERIFASAHLVYDMMYGAVPTPFMRDAETRGARQVADGLGMLVEQAAESFFVWRGVRPDTSVVLARMRDRLAQEASRR